MLCFFSVPGLSGKLESFFLLNEKWAGGDQCGKPRSYRNDLLIHIYDLDIISRLLPTG